MGDVELCQSTNSPFLVHTSGSNISDKIRFSVQLRFTDLSKKNIYAKGISCKQIMNKKIFKSAKCIYSFQFNFKVKKLPLGQIKYQKKTFKILIKNRILNTKKF